jgi:alanine racemase
LNVAAAIKDVDALAVARLDEGICLREAGIKNRINILQGFVCKKELKVLFEYNLDSVIHSEMQLDILENYQGQRKINVWLKIDTGMNRLGIHVVEFQAVYQRLLTISTINHPISIMTHFSSADDIDKQTTQKQIALFNGVTKIFPGERSLANSAAIIAWPDSISDWVRPGLMLYGISPFLHRDGEDLSLKPVMSLHSRLISVKTIAAGVAVGYGESWVSHRQTRLGVVAIGYGDGYPRYAKTGTPVLVNGKKATLVGRVSMDMLTVDLSTQPDAKPGDPVTLWGQGLAIEEIAKYSATIPYTLVCGVTQRVEIINL